MKNKYLQKDYICSRLNTVDSKYSLSIYTIRKEGGVMEDYSEFTYENPDDILYEMFGVDNDEDLTMHQVL